MYVPLWCKSNFSFLEGASEPRDLVAAARELGLPGLALVDRDGVYGAVRAYEAAKGTDFHLIIGSQVTVEDGSTLILLAQHRDGYANLCRLLTAGRLRSPKGESKVSWKEICDHAPGLIATWGGDNSILAGPLEPDAIAGALCEAFGDRLYAMATRHCRAEEREQEARLRVRAARYGIPVVAGTEVLYHAQARRELQDVLGCIRQGITLHTAGRRIKPNAEHYLHGADSFARLFADDPAAVERTREVASRCTFSLADLRYRYPDGRLPDGTTPSMLLRECALKGAAQRYRAGIPAAVSAQLEKELALIEKLDYGGYFLTMWEIVKFCRQENILCQGRGSAANSAVCYCLGITAVDPVAMNLLFERFLSIERAEPPDIDLDIEHERREEVIKHMYAKYGRAHAAMVANVITYRIRSAVRDVGKVLGLPETELDRLAKFLPQYTGFDAAMLRHAGFDPQSPVHRQLLTLATELLGFPRHLSIHPGGFLLGHEPVSTLVPIENATMPGRTVIQWDKNDIETLCLFKVDLLGLGALSQLHRCFDLLKQHHGKELSMAAIPADDKKTYDMICKADTVGVFQIESRAQMSMLPRLKPQEYYDLVIEVSIVRPGPISGGMVHPYLRRRNEEEPIKYPHPCLEPVLSKTLGIPLFQEQVMKLAMVAADYTPGEADQLRRDMAAWQRSGRMLEHRDRLISRMEKKGIPRAFGERVFKQIEGFGEYGFPESHAASFALISYAHSWLKCHYPAEFTCALLNAQPMGFYAPATLIEDAKRHGVEIRPIDVLHSQWDCTLEPIATGGLALRMGLRYVHGLGTNERKKIDGMAPFSSLDDFAGRTKLNERALVSLAAAGAFDGFHIARREALWKTRGLARVTPISLPLDGEEPAAFAPLSSLEIINWDYRQSSHSARGHPLEPVREELQSLNLPDARTVAERKGGERVRYAGLVICRQRPGTAKGVTFMTLEDETGFVNAVVWEKVFDKYQILLKTESFLGITGRLQSQHGVVHLVAETLWKPDVNWKPASAGSHDFH